MLKRSLLVLVLLAAGIALGVLATGALRFRDTITASSAEPSKPDTTRPVVSTPTLPSVLPVPTSSPNTLQDAPTLNGPLRVGVVNLKNCFDETKYEYAKDVTEELKKLEAEIDKGLKELDAQMKGLREEMNPLPKTSSLWQEKARKAKLLEMQAELDKKLGRARFIDQYSKMKLEVYNEIRRVIEIYGKDHKFDLVLRVEEPQLDDDSPETVSMQINRRLVLYHTGALDVTADLLKVLNAEYAKRKATPRSPDVPPTLNVCPTCNIQSADVKCPKCGKEFPKK